MGYVGLEMAFITLRQSRQLDIAGWTRVELNPRSPSRPADAWIRTRSSGRCHSHGWQYWFEFEEDAVMFALKWVR